jgi:hypothetical protein
MVNGGQRRHERVGNRNHLVTPAYAECLKGEAQAIGAIAYSDTECRTDKLSEFCLEPTKLFAHY